MLEWVETQDFVHGEVVGVALLVVMMPSLLTCSFSDHI